MALVRTIYPYLVGLSLAAVLAVLFAGLVAMARGGDFGKKYSNKLMRVRVITQAVAILLLVSYFLLIRG